MSCRKNGNQGTWRSSDRLVSQTVANWRREIGDDICCVLVLSIYYLSDFSRKILLDISSAVFIHSANIEQVPNIGWTLY